MTVAIQISYTLYVFCFEVLNMPPTCKGSTRLQGLNINIQFLPVNSHYRSAISRQLGEIAEISSYIHADHRHNIMDAFSALRLFQPGIF